MLASLYTGLRPGEKLTEALLSPSEEDVRPTHPLITQVPITPIDLDALRRLVEASRDAGVYTRRTQLEEDLTRVLGPSLEEETLEITGSGDSAEDVGTTS